MNAPAVAEQLPRQAGETRNETPLRIVIVGHVDHGKSTLVGRLFHDTGSLPEGKYEQLKSVCEKRGVPFEWAFLMDALKAERDQNITIDTSQIWFKTAERPYVIIDAPGHKEFLKNMVTGAASASAALLLIAADEGVREQSRRHGYLLSLLGISQVAVVVNKMDRAGYDEQRFREIEREYRAFLEKIGVAPRLFLPISAREGDNVASRSPHMSWYTGPTVLEALDAFAYPTAPADLPLRFPVQDVYRFDHRRILAGRIEAGTLKVGDKLVFHPGGKASRVASMEAFAAEPGTSAEAGQSVGVTLEEQIFVERGHVATHEESAPRVGTRLLARVFWMGQRPLEVGRPVKLKLTTEEAIARVERIERVIDASTLDEKTAERDGGIDAVKKNDVAEVILETRAPLAFDPAARVVSLGRFVLVDGYDLAGGGVIVGDAGLETITKGRVTWQERAQRHGHLPAVVVVTGASALQRRALAHDLERTLFERGLSALALEGNAAFSPSLVDKALAAATGGVVAVVESTVDPALLEGAAELPVVRVAVGARELADVVDEVLIETRLSTRGSKHGR